MPGGQFSHFRDKMSLARDTGHRGSIPGRSRPFRYGWQPYFSFSGPAEWNCLPNDLRMITDTNVFKKKLKRTFINKHFV